MPKITQMLSIDPDFELNFSQVEHWQVVWAKQGGWDVTIRNLPHQCPVKELWGCSTQAFIHYVGGHESWYSEEDCFSYSRSQKTQTCHFECSLAKVFPVHDLFRFANEFSYFVHFISQMTVRSQWFDKLMKIFAQQSAKVSVYKKSLTNLDLLFNFLLFPTLIFWW